MKRKIEYIGGSILQTCARMSSRLRPQFVAQQHILWYYITGNTCSVVDFFWFFYFSHRVWNRANKQTHKTAKTMVEIRCCVLFEVEK